MTAVFQNVDAGPACLNPGASVRILPAGVFQAEDGRPVGLPGWVIDATIAAPLVAEAKARSTPYLVDYEHQTLATLKPGGLAPAAGWFSGLEWREGLGLFMTGISWTDKARAMIAAKEYRYLSPVFKFNPATGAVTKIVNVALTNYPALIDLTDLAAAKRQGGAETVSFSQQSERSRQVFRKAFGFDLPEEQPVLAAAKHKQQRNNLAQGMAEMGMKGREAFEKTFGQALGLPTGGG